MLALWKLGRLHLMTTIQVTSKLISRRPNILSFRVDVAPKPASRARLAKIGNKNVAYHLKPYAAWLREVKVLIPEAPELMVGPVSACIEFVCKKPKKPGTLIPVGDVDNYIKAVFDAITYSGLVWNDDKQVVHTEAIKRYTGKTEEPHFFVSLKELPSEYFLPDNRIWPRFAWEAL